MSANYITSCQTGRYLFEAAPDGDVSSKRGDEGGWIHENNKPVLTADANYYNRAHWKIVPVAGQEGKVFIESCITGRYLFEAAPDGDVSSKRGDEGGWIHENNKPVLTADANYYNRAYWKIVPVGGQPGKVFIESCHTGRYLFEAAPDGDVSSKRGDEGGWIHENNKPVLTADANYYNRAYWKIDTVATTVSKGIRKALPNVKNITAADDVPRLWCAVDTAGVAGVPIAFLELTWVDQGQGNRKGHLYARKDGGAWVGVSTDAAEHELTREAFEIPAAVLGGKLELGYSVGHGGGHKLFIKNAEVEITEREDLITVGNHSGQLLIGCNSNDEIWYRAGVGAGGNWLKLDGALKQVSISSDAQHIIGCNSKDEVWYREGVGGNWLKLDGALKQVSISSNGKHIIGCNSKDEVWYREGVNGEWRMLDGSLKQVSISSNGKHIIGCNSKDEVWYREGVNGEWRFLDGLLKQVSISSNGQHVIGCNSKDEIWYRPGVAPRNGDVDWRMLDGKLKHCTVGSVTQGMADEDD